MANHLVFCYTNENSGWYYYLGGNPCCKNDAGDYGCCVKYN